MSNKLSVSESVCAGHPDKIADQISDAIVDAALRDDKNSRVAAEVMVAKDTIVVAGEIATTAKLDYADIARKVVEKNGYTQPTWGFTNKATVITKLHQQSPDIAIGVDSGGAGDQGLMYGYATNETETLMPLAISIAHSLCQQIDLSRTKRKLDYLRPDGKAQVVIERQSNGVAKLRHITIAVPHDESVSLQQVREDIITTVIATVCYNYALDLPKEIIVNGTGVWHIPGPVADVGLTGRKIIVDTYGGAAKAGGGAFSGKDPSKVDRSGAYAARFIAKNIVAHGLADKAEVCLAYYIGALKPIIYTIETFDTAKTSQKTIRDFASGLLDVSVTGIIDGLQLRQPIYSETSVYGHFGKVYLPWENVV